jgi:hypothetical protein
MVSDSEVHIHPSFLNKFQVCGSVSNLLTRLNGCSFFREDFFVYKGLRVRSEPRKATRTILTAGSCPSGDPTIDEMR